MVIDLFPLNTVLFPKAKLPLHIFESRYLDMIETCMKSHMPFGVILLKSGEAEGVGSVALHRVGTTAHILSAQHHNDGTIDLNVIGDHRFEVIDIIEPTPRVVAEVKPLEWTDLDRSRVHDLEPTLVSKFSEYLATIMALTGQWLPKMDLPKSPVRLAEYVSAGLQVDKITSQELLEETSVAQLMAKQLELLDTEVAKLAKMVELAESRRSN